MRSILRVPLMLKLAGGNLLILFVAAAAIAVVGRAAAGVDTVVVAAVALAMALVLNVLLVSAANDRKQARSLASAVVRATDRERARVGHELQDSIAQSVAALRFHLVAAEQESAEPQTKESLRVITHMAGQLLEEIKLLSLSTHPRLLHDLGVVAALRCLLRYLKVESLVELRVDSQSEEKLGAISTDVASVLYIVAQEAIHNAVRHGSPRRIVLTARMAQSHIELQIDDDGTGFNVEFLHEGQRTTGLLLMRERAALVNGLLEVFSVSTVGTTVRVRIPVGDDVQSESEREWNRKQWG